MGVEGGSHIGRKWGASGKMSGLADINFPFYSGSFTKRGTDGCLAMRKLAVDN